MNTEPGVAVRAKALGPTGWYGAGAVLVFFLIFFNLGGRLFWGDEAETGLLAKNILKYGLPKVHDGLNDIAVDGDAVDANADGVWTWSPWLKEYMTAGSFAIFGPTTWAGRLPSAGIGWLDVMLTGLVGWKIYRSHRVALAGMLLLGTSEIFLLHVRQCRYYSVSVLGEILLVYGVYQLFIPHRQGVWLVALSLILLFFSNYVIAAANLPALLFLAWRLHRQGKHGVPRVAAILGILLAAALPWLAYAHQWDQSHAVGRAYNFWKLREYWIEFHLYFMPLCVLLLPLIGWLSDRANRAKTEPGGLPSWEQYVLVLVPTYSVVIVVVPDMFLRYLLPTLPAVCLVAAAWMFRYVKWPALAVALLLVQSVSNIFSWATIFPFRHVPLRSPLLDYVRGLPVHYADRCADVIEFFQENARPGDRVLTFDPEFPLIFYTKLRIMDARFMTNGLTQWPEWILAESAGGIRRLPPAKLGNSMKSHYDPIVLDIHDSPRWDDVPEPDVYQYEPTTNREEFMVYKLKPGG